LCGAAAAPLFTKAGAPFYRCLACDFRFARPPSNPNFENRLEDFEAAYLHYLRPEPVDAVNFAALWRWMERFGRLNGGALLDVGCGSGKLVRFLRGRGVEAYGLEPCRALFDHFLSGEPWFAHGTAADAAVPRERYEVVTAFDVLEHVDRPAELLGQLAARLSPGGRLYLSTPDVGSLAARMLGRRWHFYGRYHLSYFSPRIVTALAARYGLVRTHCSWRGRHRSLGYALRYLLEFVAGRAAPPWLAPLDRVTLPINLFDTMYLCFRKPALVGRGRLEAA
jgi:2-polyprenyl-3-methyl-5-hydroxy-6-metoxy-1,4-benzoquinol methylase